jgi:hemolysin activation/secretion protein
LSTLDIEKAVYPFLGPARGIKDVDSAREALEKSYHDAGYLSVSVDIPEQQVEGGIVTLRVVEGTVEKLRVKGSRYYSLGAIRARVPELAAGNVPNFPVMQEEIAQLNRGTDRRVAPVLKQGTTPGTVQVDLNVQDSLPLHGSLELNDRYSANTTRTRLAGMLRYDNLWQRDHSLTLNFQTTPEKTSEVKVFSASYLMPVPDSDKMIALYGVRSNSNVAAVGALNVIGNGHIFGARLIAPLRGRENYYHSLTFGIDRKDFKETVSLVTGTVDTPIGYTPVFGQYSGTEQDASGITQFNVALNLGVRGLLGNHEDEFANKRFKAHANYAYVRSDLQRTQNLPRNWVLAARLDLQFASQPLINNEQFVAGGYESVRGYLEAEQLGDDALRGSLELRSPSLFKETQFNLIGFIEGAEVRIKDPLPAQTERFDLSSAGVGFRLKALKTLNAALDIAWPFSNTANTHTGGARLKFKLAYEF